MGTSSSSIPKVHQSIFDRITAPENLFAAWDEFHRGKQWRDDVQRFEFDLERNIFRLHRELRKGTYRHALYAAFTISDPKQRQIHKACVRDRVLHHAVFAVINPIVEPTFIAYSFSCRVGKGTHKAVDALERMLWKESRNATRPCFALKCDVHRFFATVDHAVLLRILRRLVPDDGAMGLLGDIVQSFPSDLPPNQRGTGIPIGNLTSQLFANVYMNELDQFIKHRLCVRRYVRYTDDFVIVSESEEYLESLLHPIRGFLRHTLRLSLHPHKATIRKYRQGIDFLGYVLLPHHRVLRTKTQRRMVRKLRERARECGRGDVSSETLRQSLQSYRGVLSHADTYRLRQELENDVWFTRTAPAVNGRGGSVAGRSQRPTIGSASGGASIRPRLRDADPCPRRRA